MSMSNGFLHWLEKEIGDRAWRNSELARKSGLSESTISRTLNGGAKITYDFCNGIARAFKMRPEPLYRMAGLSPPLPPAVDDEQQVIELYRTLDERERSIVKRQLTGLVSNARTVSETGPPPREKKREMETPQLLGKAVLDLNHPIRQLYETLFEVLTDEQFARLITRLAEKAAENRATLGREDETRATAKNRVVQLSGGIGMFGERDQ